jgi:hypothetical protein
VVDPPAANCPGGCATGSSTPPPTPSVWFGRVNETGATRHPQLGLKRLPGPGPPAKTSGAHAPPEVFVLDKAFVLIEGHPVFWAGQTCATRLLSIFLGVQFSFNIAVSENGSKYYNNKPYDHQERQRI